ncbi:TetR family transcriptional regulator [Psychromicrobium lacuslunae]|uniref:TetR family transcriptional regulator n=1 Tax=Psychromicrobium lacuslunae TaxID=1618207 RepID=A0A0D4C3B3_9MICC|nr:TetR family transcriptional regulator [Psychromicrobium lacuslunae]
MTATADSAEEHSVDGRSARWASHREQRRAELIKVARRAVHRLGPDASMDDIAAAAGTSKSVFYRYFGDKAGLQQAVGEVVIGQMQGVIFSAIKTARDPRNGLKNMVSAYLHMAETSPNVYAFVTQAAPGQGVAKVPDIGHAGGALGGFFDAIIEMVAAPMREHFGGAETPLARYWPTAAIGLVRTAGESWLDGARETQGNRPDAEEMAEQITQWLFLGIETQLNLPK